MKLPKELYNGFIIAVSVALFFLLMELLGFADLYYLRLFNIIFVFYGVNRTIKMNFIEGKRKYIFNIVSAMITSIIGVCLTVFGLLIYSYIKGGDSYVQSLSETFLFGGKPTIMTYCISLLFEGIASSVIVVFLLMLYWNNKYTAD